MKTEQKNFFTADLHLGHRNVIKYCNRPFTTADEMDEAIISNWNATLAPRDFVYIIGDVGMTNAERLYSLLKRMNGIKILIYGNHDKVIRNSTKIRDLFHETHEFLERYFHVDGQKVLFVMCHYAMRVWNKSHHGSVHLYGHSHGTMPDAGNRSMDVGMDPHSMLPVSLEQVMSTIGNRPLKQFDHHEPKDQM